MIVYVVLAPIITLSMRTRTYGHEYCQQIDYLFLNESLCYSSNSMPHEHVLDILMMNEALQKLQRQQLYSSKISKIYNIAFIPASF